MSEQQNKWNFDITRMSDRDVNACLFFLEHLRLPTGHEVNDEPEDLETYGTGSEVHLIELAALYAQGVLSVPDDPIFGTNGFVCAGELPDTVNPDHYEGMQHHSPGGINLNVTYLDYSLAELAPILIKYPFYE